jgi:acylphosphatase
MPKLLKAKIHGKVQGVGFRFETLRKAKELGLAGFVRNDHDKTVYVEAQGPSANVDRFLHWLEHHGPAEAEIGRVEHHTTFDLENYGGFKIMEIGGERHPVLDR